MTATRTQIRRGTAAQCDAMTPAEGEVIADLTNDRLRLGDGLLAGGHLQASAKDVQNNAFTAATAGGTANALTLTLSPAPTGYVTHMGITFRAAATNTGAATINVNSLGVKDFRKVSGGSLVALAAGDLVNGAYYTAIYDGTNFVVQNIAPTPTPSGLVLLGTATSTGSSFLTFTSLMNSSYDDYILYFNLCRAVSNGIELHMQVSTNNGSSWSTSFLFAGNQTSRWFNGKADLFNFTNSGMRKAMRTDYYSADDATPFTGDTFTHLGIYVGATAINAIRIIGQGGVNIISGGTARLYGVSK